MRFKENYAPLTTGLNFQMVLKFSTMMTSNSGVTVVPSGGV